MATNVRVLVLSGFGRPSAVTSEVSRVLKHRVVSAGGSAADCNLRELGLPLYDGEEDLSTFPEAAKRLAATMRSHQAFFLIAPEYHNGIAPLVKNAFDWAAKAHILGHGEALLKGKVSALITVSAGPNVGVQALTQMGALCLFLGSTVLPGSLGILDRPETLAPDASIKDQGVAQRLDGLVAELILSTR